MKKEWTGWLLLAGALIVGVLAFWLVGQYLESREKALRLDLLSGRDEFAPVIVTKTDLYPGDVISEANVAAAEMPVAHIPRMAIKPSQFERIKGRVVDRELSHGEMLQADFIAGLIVDRFSGLLNENERAISVNVSSLQSYSGLLLPGDFIDLYVITTNTSIDGTPTLVPVLERVKLLAAGGQPLRSAEQSFQPLDDSSSNYNMITVGLVKEKAERLALAQEAGDIVFFLRNAEDESLVSLDQELDLFSPSNRKEDGYVYISLGVPQGELRTPSHHPEKHLSSPEDTDSPANLTPISPSPTGMPTDPDAVSQTNNSSPDLPQS